MLPSAMVEYHTSKSQQRRFLWLKSFTFTCAAMICIKCSAETHSALQAVDSHGASAWNGTHPFSIRGVIICSPKEMLDSTPNFLPWNSGANSGNMGAEWQIVIQAVDENDFGGTFLWLGQNYGNQPWIRDEALSYTNEAWEEEVTRVSQDPDTGHIFQAGDYVEVYVRNSLFYGGKRNINEAHNISPDRDFDIHLIEANRGLPEPAAINLSDLVLPCENDTQTQIDIFDATRQTGGERYQGTRVRINGLQIVYADGWDENASWANRGNNLVTDGENRFFSVRHPLYDLGDAPIGTFDAIGIINQESGSGTEGTTGYELFIQEIIQSQTAPTLNLSSDGILSWDSAFADQWILEAASAPYGEWTPVSEEPTIIDKRCQLQILPTEKQSFFRLKIKTK